MCDLKEYGFCAVQKRYFFHYGLALGVGSLQCIGYFVFFSTSTLTKLQLFSSVYSNGSHFCLVAVILEPRTGVNKGIEFLFRPEKEYGQSLTLDFRVEAVHPHQTLWGVPPGANKHGSNPVLNTI